MQTDDEPHTLRELVVDEPEKHAPNTQRYYVLVYLEQTERVDKPKGGGRGRSEDTIVVLPPRWLIVADAPTQEACKVKLEDYLKHRTLRKPTKTYVLSDSAVSLSFPTLLRRYKTGGLLEYEL